MSESFLKRVKNDAEMKDLRINRKKFKRLNDARELSDIYCRMGHCMRELYRQAAINNQKFEQKIIKKYQNAVEMGKSSDSNENCSLAYRALAEMAMEKDAEEAVFNIDRSMQYALKARNPSFIQLCYHQCAFIYSTVADYSNSAAKLAEEGLVYLQEHATEINKDAYEVKTGGDSARRKAGLENLLAGIYVDADNFAMAQKHNERCLDYAVEHNDVSLHCRALNLKLRMATGRARLDIALELSERVQKIPEKNAQIKFEAEYYLGVESLRFNGIFDAKRLFWRLHEKHSGRLDELDRENVQKYLVFIYKTERRLRRISEELNTDKGKSPADLSDKLSLQAQIYEKIADEAIELPLAELSYHFYECMLSSSASIEQKRLALVSLAETARDLKNYSSSAHYFRELLEVEKKLGFSSAKLLLTEMSIAIVSANISTISLMKRYQLFEETYKKCLTNVDKQNLLVDYVEFLNNNPGLCTDDEFDEKCETLRTLRNSNEDDGHSAPQLPDTQDSVDLEENLMNSNYSDELDELSEFEIFHDLKKEMKLLEEEIQLSKKVDAIVNNQGETRMHVVARTEDFDLLKKLIRMGYNVNAKDNGGWTPLSEAVSANQIRNVRLLLESGADVNCRSIHGLTGDDDEEDTASGHTPLMEACSSGNIDMARILITLKAGVVQADDDGWTCVDFLRAFYNRTSEDLDDSEKDKVVKFIGYLERKQRLAGFIPRSSPPRVRRRKLKKCIPTLAINSAFGNGLDAETRSEQRRSGSPLSGEEENDDLTKSVGSVGGHESDGSMDELLLSLCSSTKSKTKISKKNAALAATEDERNLKEYRQTMSTLGRKPNSSNGKSVLQRKKFASSLADALDEQTVKTYNILDKTRGVLPADYEFLAPEDDENDDYLHKTSTQSSLRNSERSRSRSASRKLRELDEEECSEEEDDVLASIRARQRKRRKLT